MRAQGFATHAVSVTAAALLLAGSPTAAPAAGGTWGKAQEVPGTATLNVAGDAEVSSVSCASAGTCSAGGYYSIGTITEKAFVAAETGGVWGKAEEVPGTATLSAGGNAGVDWVSCASAGNCSAVGGYSNSSGTDQVFVANETGGRWGRAEEVPGTAALNTGGGAVMTSVSCASAGNCSAGGAYSDSSGFQAFIVNEKGGVWGKAEQVPGTAALNAGGQALVMSVSCASAGNCSAAGEYADSRHRLQAFVVDETGGRWHKAKEVAGIAVLNAGGKATITSVSCASAGNCSAGGYYTLGSSDIQAFVVSETGGVWGKAEEVPGTATAVNGPYPGISSVSCASAGNCSAGGYYRPNGSDQAFVVSERGGVWGKAEEVPGTAVLNVGGIAEVSSVSCASAGNCSAVGRYTDGLGRFQVFVVNQTGGAWGNAEEVPGTATLNARGDAGFTSVSCAPRGNCNAGGYYTGKSGSPGIQAFVVSETNGRS